MLACLPVCLLAGWQAHWPAGGYSWLLAACLPVCWLAGWLASRLLLAGWGCDGWGGRMGSCAAFMHARGAWRLHVGSCCPQSVNVPLTCCISSAVAVCHRTELGRPHIVCQLAPSCPSQPLSVSCTTTLPAFLRPLLSACSITCVSVCARRFEKLHQGNSCCRVLSCVPGVSSCSFPCCAQRLPCTFWECWYW